AIAREVFSLALHDALPIYRRNISAAASYSTGTHTIKFGFSDAFGKNDRISSINGDIVQQYTHATVNGKDTVVPLNVLVYNTPTRSEEHTSELQSRGHLVCR